MGYDYDREVKSLLESASGPAVIVRSKDRIDAAIQYTGSITYAKAADLTELADSWQKLAVIDYLVQHGFYYRLQGVGNATQDQILVAKTR